MMRIFSMKKSICILGLTISILVWLTSCQVKWFDKSYDVPWWVIAISTALFVLAVWYFAGKIISKKEYICQTCKGSFYPKWYVAAFTIHINDDRVFKCPYCGKKGFCHVSRDGGIRK